MPERVSPVSERLRQTSLLFWVMAILFLLLAGAGGSGAWYGYNRLQALSQKVAQLEGEMAQTNAALETDIAKANSVLTAAIDDQSKSIKETVSTIAGSVSTLEKLTQTDPQLLAKYSKIYFLNENYVPKELVNIPAEYMYFENRQAQLIPEVSNQLVRMLTAARKDNIELYVFSSYRSFAEQKSIKSSYSVTYGAGTANQFSADQGYSEHQLGTTVDMITKGLGGVLTPAFGKTPAYEWLANNAHMYGFALSYPESNAYYIYEPWHWRFVGIKLATQLRNDGRNFYDLSQRAINTHLVDLFDAP